MDAPLNRSEKLVTKVIIKKVKKMYIFFLNFVYVGRVPDPTSHFLPTSFLCVNLVAMGPVHLSLQSPGPKHYGIR
jgi:hypothetical protein